MKGGNLIVKELFTRQETMDKNRMREGRRPRLIPSTMLLVLCVAAAIGFTGCGLTANPVTPASAGKVYSYFGGPFTSTNASLPISISTFDHSAGNINVTSFISEPTGQVPSGVLSGTFVSAPTGFLSVTENFSTTTGVLLPLNPPLTGAWAVEIPGAGAIGNLLSLSKAGAGFSISAAPVAMAENSACPNFQTATPFLYVTVPTASTLTSTAADYGSVAITTSGSAVTFNAQPYLVGQPMMLAASTVAGGCSETYYGPLTAYPLNSFATASNLELINIGKLGFLLSTYSPSPLEPRAPGAFGGGTGVIGVAEPSGPVDVGAVIGAKYNGFLYSPKNIPAHGYDITVLASAFGNYASNSQACSMLQSSLAANHGQGANSVPALPSANSLYGGEFLTATSSGSVNDPTGANGPENCDMVMDLGTQDPANNGLFPNATVFIGSNFPPFSATNPWNCFGTTSACAVSFPATAVVGQVQGQYVIFVTASATSTPVAAQLPITSGAALVQPVGIYLIQRSQ